MFFIVCFLQDPWRRIKGNFAQMLKVLAKSMPFTLASLSNLSSTVYFGNFVDALMTSATHTHPAAVSQSYMVSDDEYVSKLEFLRLLGEAMWHCARLLRSPPALLKNGWTFCWQITASRFKVRSTAVEDHLHTEDFATGRRSLSS